MRLVMVGDKWVNVEHVVSIEERENEIQVFMVNSKVYVERSDGTQAAMDKFLTRFRGRPVSDA